MSKMSILDNANDVNENCIMTYCDGSYCEGVQVNEDIRILDEDASCPICYDELNGRIGFMKPCKHYFCDRCAREWRTSESKATGCSMCRSPVEKVVYTNKLIADLSKIPDVLTKQHMTCQIRSEFKEYLTAINDEWQELVHFIIRSQVSGDYDGITGIENLQLQEYEEKECMLDKSKAMVVLKSGELDQVIISCYVPNLSFRVRITKGDDFDFDVDNEYADNVVNYLNRQMRICWKVVPQIISRNYEDKIYIRKFEKYTAALLLCGYEDCGWNNHHYAPMREKLWNINRTNFAVDHFKNARNQFPFIKLDIRLTHNIDYYSELCCKTYVEAAQNRDDRKRPEDKEDEDTDISNNSLASNAVVVNNNATPTDNSVDTDNNVATDNKVATDNSVASDNSVAIVNDNLKNDNVSNEDEDSDEEEYDTSDDENLSDFQFDDEDD